MKQLSRIALAVAVLAGSTPAYAVCDGCVTGAVTRASVTITGAVQSGSASVSTAVTTSAASISALMNTLYLQLNTTLRGLGQATNAQIAQAGKMQADTVIQTATAVEKSRIAQRYSVGDPCAVAIGGSGMPEVWMSTASAGAAVGRGGGGARSGGTGSYAGASAALQKSLNWSNGKEAAPSPEVQAQTAAFAGCDSFAGSGPRAELCTKAGLRPGNAVGYPNADIVADTVFDGPQSNPAQPVKRYSVDMSGKEGTAIHALVRNIEVPLDLRTLNPGELRTDEGRRYMALKDAYDARMSLAGRPLRRHIASITATTASKPVLEQMLASTTAQNFVTTQLNRRAPGWQTKGVSQDELMALEVERRYMNLDWHKAMVAATPEDVARETLQLMAFQSVQLQQIGTELRELNLVLGGQAASQVRAESVPQLLSAHKAATR